MSPTERAEGRGPTAPGEYRAAESGPFESSAAARLLALVRSRRPARHIADLGVVYEIEAMLDGLRDRLGHDVIEEILSGAAIQPLPDPPDWSTSPTPGAGR